VFLAFALPAWHREKADGRASPKQLQLVPPPSWGARWVLSPALPFIAMIIEHYAGAVTHITASPTRPVGVRAWGDQAL
jgi:hypothetical protein